MSKPICPACFAPVRVMWDAAGGEDRPGRSGDYAMCYHCTTLLRFTSATTFAILTDEALSAIEPKLRAYMLETQRELRARTEKH